MSLYILFFTQFLYAVQSLFWIKFVELGSFFQFHVLSFSFYAHSLSYTQLSISMLSSFYFATTVFYYGVMNILVFSSSTSYQSASSSSFSCLASSSKNRSNTLNFFFGSYTYSSSSNVKSLFSKKSNPLIYSKNF